MWERRCWGRQVLSLLEGSSLALSPSIPLALGSVCLPAHLPREPALARQPHSLSCVHPQPWLCPTFTVWSWQSHYASPSFFRHQCTHVLSCPECPGLSFLGLEVGDTGMHELCKVKTLPLHSLLYPRASHGTWH